METKYIADTKRKAIQEKIKLVQTVSEELGNYPTVALIDLRKLPDALLQKVRKKVREGGGVVRILKKPVLERVLKSNKKLEHMSAECNKPMALIMTPMSPFQLYKFFETNKKRRAAKAGDVAPFDIIVPEGETDLPPGPALSELKTAGLNVQIKAGKIIIAKDSTVSKSGERITDIKAKALQKVGIMPFEISVNYLYGFAGQSCQPFDVVVLTAARVEKNHHIPALRG